MSYAQAAAPHGKAQNQTLEEKMPDHVPEIVHEDSGVHSLESLNSVDEHIQSLPSDTSYAGQQEAEERAAEVRRQGQQSANKLDQEATDFMNAAEKSANDLKSDAKKDGKKLEKKAGAEFEKAEKKAEEKFEKAKDKAQEGYGKAKKEGAKVAKEVEKDAKKAGDWAEKNQNNPVILGNAVAIAGLAALLGTGAYRAHKANTLTWNVIGAWAGVVGIFAVGDYYVSQYFFKKYPPKN